MEASSISTPGVSPVIIKTENVNKRFGSLHVLKDVSLEVRKNEVVVIIGPSGSGKSTFLRCIARPNVIPRDLAASICPGSIDSMPARTISAM